MKKIIALTMSLLMLFMPIYNATDVYGITSEELAEREKLEDEGEEDGKYFGIVDGYNAGIANFKDGNEKYSYSNTYTKDLNIYLNSDEYKKKSYYYLRGFKTGYKDGYIEGYSMGIDGKTLNYSDLIKYANKKEDEVVGSNGSNDGDRYGSNLGSFAAQADFYARIISQPTESFNRFQNEKSISSRFYLDLYEAEYASDFVEAFKTSYLDSYTTTYYQLLSVFSEQNLEYSKLDKDTTVAKVGTTDLNLSFEYESGSFFGFVYIGASKDRVPVSYDSNRLIYVDSNFMVDTYSIENYNRKEYMTSKKPFTMSIPFSVISDNLGIYEYKYGAWQYIYTEATDGYLKHTFSAGDFDGGNYCVFIEPSVKVFTDTYFSPFYDEIYTYARRGAIYSTSDKLNPFDHITRGEVAYLFNGILNPNNKKYNSIEYTDLDENSPFYTATKYMSYKGLLYGVNETEFDAEGKVTYNQLKSILEKQVGYVDFNPIFERMQNERFYKSEGASNMDAFVTKEDAIFIVHSILK